MNGTILEAHNLVKRFGRVAAVNDVSFSVEQGEVLTLLGPSGCGKTTTLRMIAGFEKPDGGDISIQGRVVVATSRRIHIPPEKRGLGMVFQSYAIWPHMTVFENVAYPLVVRREKNVDIRRRVDEVLELVGLSGLASRPSMLLSGGQQQRVALARALVYSPSILLLDEPLSNLDAKLRTRMRIELKRLQSQLNITVLFVTHDQVEAMTLSTRLAVMNQGRIEQLGSPQEVYEHPQTPFVEDFLGQVWWFRGVVAEKNRNGVQVEIEGVPGTQLRVDTADPALDVGGHVVVAIRPEAVQVNDAGSEQPENMLPCRVENVIHLGAEVELVFHFGDLSYTLRVPRTGLPAIAHSLALYLPAEHLRIWTTGDEDSRSGSVTEGPVGWPLQAE